MDQGMNTLKVDVKKRDFSRIKEVVSKINQLARWLVDHPKSPDPAYVKYLQGVEAHVKMYAETLDREAGRNNGPNADYALRLLGQQVDNIRNSYNRVPEPKPETVPAPVAAATEPARADTESKSSDTAPASDTKPVAAPDTKTAAPPAPVEKPKATAPRDTAPKPAPAKKKK